MGVAALAVEQGAAELMLELLDGARQGRLADVALLRRPREIQRPGKRDEIAHLLHFHGAIPLMDGSELLHAGGRERDTDGAWNRCALGL